MSTRALIICNGEPPPARILRRLAREADLLVAADGGANIARTAGLQPDIVIGDLDSITPATRKYCSGARIIRVSRQDNTDLEKALDHLSALRVGEVTVAAATGRRVDFTLANLSVSWLYTPRMRIRFAGDGWSAIPLRRRIRVEAAPGTAVSLIPFGRCSGITLRGLKYPLTNGVLDHGSVAVSNVVVRSPYTVAVTRGRLLLVMLERIPGTRA